MAPSISTPLSKPTSPSPPENLALPRLLCLHGGGVNGSIFRAQLRSFHPRLSSHFRLIYPEAPFLCPPHPDVISVYSDYAPFRRWLRWQESHSYVDDESMIEEITYQMRSAMEEDDRLGGTGPWVGMMGFSQGAKLAACMLLEQQVREQDLGKGKGVGTCGIAGVHWEFAILFAGRAPLVVLDPARQKESKALLSVAGIAEQFKSMDNEEEVGEEAIITTPTVHVHGLADPGLQFHRKLFKEYCKPGSAQLLEWEGVHRLPLKSKDVDPVVAAIFDIAKKTGVIV